MQIQEMATMASASTPLLLQADLNNHRLLYANGPVINFWSVYVILLLVGCMFVAVCEFYRKRQQMPVYISREQNEEEIKKHDETRRKEMEKALRETTITVKGEDLIPNEENDPDVEVGGEEMALQLPPSKKTDDHGDKNDEDRRQLVPASCAICLASYEVGDLVTYSPSSCSHVFHRDCIQTWFDRPKNYINTEDEVCLYNCPSCRQGFWSKEEMKAWKSE